MSRGSGQGDEPFGILAVRAGVPLAYDAVVIGAVYRANPSINSSLIQLRTCGSFLLLPTQKAGHSGNPLMLVPMPASGRVFTAG